MSTCSDKNADVSAFIFLGHEEEECPSDVGLPRKRFASSSQIRAYDAAERLEILKTTLELWHKVKEGCRIMKVREHTWLE